MKLAAGAKSPKDLAAWQARTEREDGGRREHVTRMWPKREDELLDGGSLYWAVAKKLAFRQRILGLERVKVAGVPKCRILLDRQLVAVRPVPRRPFQGWRYLEPDKAPPDLAPGTPRDLAELERTLAALGLL